MVEQDIDSDINLDGDSGGEDGRSGRGGNRRFRRFGTGRRRKCTPCDDIKFDWKDTAMLQRFQTPQGKMMSRKRTNYCSQCQRELARAIKRARFMALVPYVA
jgi:small subunit ribosomal protein S18